MDRLVAVALAGTLLVGSGCSHPQEERPPRAELRRITGNTFELLPTQAAVPTGKDGQRYCLVFTQASTGVIRQLTMTQENKSVRCAPGEPIGHVRYRIPVEEGPVRVHIFFSDQKLNAGSIAAQLYEHKGDPSFHPMDLRLPGDVVVETLEFRPKTPGGSAPEVGARVGPSGEIERTATVPAAGTADGGR
ncbi:MAG: hypothetical protein IRZ16_15910 [Myxococcaceae bacterium]|nr:hypothetical protein [Myxococcaceae bacterium]